MKPASVAFAFVAGWCVASPSCGKGERAIAEAQESRSQEPGAEAPQKALAQEPKPQPTRLARPKLVVLCSIDQLASWVFEDARQHFAQDGGFRRLLDEGVWFSECAFQHACTETGPGHATIGTGAPAVRHGIVKNEWYDRDTKAKAYCAGDPKGSPLDAFPEGKGRGPARLLVPTIGDLLDQADARAKVVAVAHKDRSAILMAGARADAVVWFENATGRFVTNARWGALPPPWLLDFNAQDLPKQWFGWKWERFAPDPAYAGLVDDRPFEAPHLTTKSRTLPAEVRGGGAVPGVAFHTESYVSPLGNELVLECAVAALRGEQLGKDEHADLFCVAFSALDTVGHYFGPDSVEARDVLLRIDRQLATLLDALDREVGVGAYAFVLTADHGVGLPPESALAQGLGGGRSLIHTQCKAAAEQALRAEFGGDAASPYVAHAGEYSLVLDRARVDAMRGDRTSEQAFARACEVAAAACAKAKGVRRGYARHEVDGRVADEDPTIAALANAAHERAGDVLIVVEPYWLEPSLPASHGTPHDYDRRVPLLAMGPMLQRGIVAKDPVTPGLGAVLAAWWFGIEAPVAAVDELPQSAMVK